MGSGRALRGCGPRRNRRAGSPRAPPLVFGGLVLAAWADDFHRVTWITLTILGLLTLLCFVIDFVATMLGATRVGSEPPCHPGKLWPARSSESSLAYWELVSRTFLSARVAGELMAHGRVKQASRVGVATWLGLIFGTLAMLALTFAMLGIFAFAYFF